MWGRMMTRRNRPFGPVCTAGLWLAAAGFAPGAAAHDARPLSVNIAEQSPNLYVARILVPPTVDAADQPDVIWPSGCEIASREPARPPAVASETEVVRCDTSLEGLTLRIAYPVFNPSLSTLFRLHEASGKVVTSVLTPDRLEWTVPREPGWREVAADYLGLGVRHIWTGVDHLLFVTALLILAGTMRRTLLAITGFTVAHSVTLSLSALDLVRLPVAPVEAAIALSILFLAREIAAPHPENLASRYPMLVSSSFGLLHGFGFAAALREVGLPTKELAVGLLSFNLGVEMGQIVFIAGVLAGAYACRRLSRGGSGRLLAAFGPRPEVLAGYALGVPAAFWLVQRLGAF